MAVSPEKKVGFFFLLGIIHSRRHAGGGREVEPFRKDHVPIIPFLPASPVSRSATLSVWPGSMSGRSTKSALLDGKVRIDFEVKPGTAIKTDTVASLRLTNLLGGQFLGISFGSPAAPLLPPGGQCEGRMCATIDRLLSITSAI